MTSVRGRALSPLGVNVTEEMVASVEPQFHEIPTSMRRLPPVPVVWAKLMPLVVAAAVPVSTAPSMYAVPGGMAVKVAVTSFAASTVTVVVALLGSVTPVPVQPLKM
jgi:hypothetical protein